MTFSHAVPRHDSTPTPTTPKVRCALALNILQQRPHDDRTVELVAAVMRGVKLAELIDVADVTE